MADISKCQEKLLMLSSKQGYLTFDDIISASDTFSLSVADVDRLSEAIQIRGVIVYETAPVIAQDDDYSEEGADFSRTDFDFIFVDIVKEAPHLKAFIEEIRRYPAPQHGEINQLARQLREGNTFARERMFKLYARNALKIALSMAKQYDLELEDAISSGFVGLLNAVDKYNPDGFSAFNSYASMWIQQNIQRECNPIWFQFYFPAHIQEKMFRSYFKYESYSSGDDRNSPDRQAIIERISRELGVVVPEVEMLLRRVNLQKYDRISIEELIEQEHSGDIISDSPVISENESFARLYEIISNEIVFGALERLSPKEASVIKQRYGLGGFAPKTLEEVGQQMKVTRERVRQIEVKALRKLRKPAISEKFIGLLE